MKIAIYSAATRETRSGNWITASRWQRLLRSAGCQVSILHDEVSSDNCDADLLIGLHARRSGPALIRFRRRYPQRHTIVVLSGTDIYRDLAPQRKRKSATAIRALDECDRIILLQPLMAKRLKARWRRKCSLVMMDVPAVKAPGARKVDSTLKACVVGHMRYEKDPLRSAMAVRHWDFAERGVAVTHAGQALSDSFHERATREAKQNSNWTWLGSVSHLKVQQVMAASDLLINSSRAEGAPNVLFEAIGWRLPVIASRIDGHVGILGSNYPGYFRVGDTKGLKRLLLRCASEPRFYRSLVTKVDSLAKKYRSGNELRALQKAISACD